MFPFTEIHMKLLWVYWPHLCIGRNKSKWYLYDTVYPMKYAHGFAVILVLCFVIIFWFFMDSCATFSHILQSIIDTSDTKVTLIDMVKAYRYQTIGKHGISCTFNLKNISNDYWLSPNAAMTTWMNCEALLRYKNISWWWQWCDTCFNRQFVIITYQDLHQMPIYHT